MTTGKILREKRKSLNGVLTEYSDRIKISQVYLGDIERDNRPFPVDRFEKIMDVYKFSHGERTELALHLFNHGRVNEQTRKYLNVEVKK